MGTSEMGGAIAFDPADLGGDRFADATLIRRLISTAKHKADQAGQVVVNWSAPPAALWQVDSNPYQELVIGGWVEALGEELYVATEGEGGSRWFAFPSSYAYCPHVRAAGDAYRLRVRMAGCSSNGERVDFGLVVAPFGTQLLEYGDISDVLAGSIPEDPDRLLLGYPRKLWTGITSTTPAWLTPDDGSNVITIPRHIVDRSITTQRTVTDIGGSPVDVAFPLLQITPVGQTYGAISRPQIHALYVAEFVGAT